MPSVQNDALVVYGNINITELLLAVAWRITGGFPFADPRCPANPVLHHFDSLILSTHGVLFYYCAVLLALLDPHSKRLKERLRRILNVERKLEIISERFISEPYL